MAGLTKAQRAEKEAAKVAAFKKDEEESPTQTAPTEEVVDAQEEAIKYRCDFNNYDKYTQYKGAKG